MKAFLDAFLAPLQMQLLGHPIIASRPDPATRLYLVLAQANVRLRLGRFEMQMRRAKFQTAFAQGVFQGGALRIQLDVKPPHLEEIGDAQKDFHLVERLKQKIGRAGGEGSASGGLVGIGREHDDREKDLAAGGPQGMKDGKSIHVRHHQIEEDQVRRELVANFEGQAGIGNGPHLFVTCFGEHVLQKLDVHRFVINNEDLHPAERLRSTTPLVLTLEG
jgi:hypothetical protein